MLLLSTDSDVKLSEYNDALIMFDSELPGLSDEVLLKHPNRWFVGSAHGCSCGFRHIGTGMFNLGFVEPETWYEEEPEDIEATLRCIKIIRTLIDSGAKVDCIDVWTNDENTSKHTITKTVSLGDMNNKQFRFFENHHFVFSSKLNPAVQ